MSPGRCRVDVFLTPGELTVQDRPVYIKTIVGSCVAVCLWDPGARVGGVNHYLLARPAGEQVPDTRFGSCAIPTLLDRMARAGALVARLEAAVVGGGNPVESMRESRIGAENIEIALALLADQGVAVRRRETGGNHGRKLLFSTHDGALIVRRLERRLIGAVGGPAA